ncbi:PREDICTED: uncharacterized protein LOC109162687 [Ipomoea nil]|uniref:uncharacterized protein LOC109162687 n=1 Tax=Ipomoea nil TaxID=35883 RepID=UPI000901211E|nr:PREDICTED: uncharacterized protein LOC109162687 [Ipomoea nil]
MEDSFSKTSKQPILQTQSSSRNRAKLQLTFSLLIFFSLIIASIICVFNVLKHHAQSQSLSHNPENAIHSVCSFTSDPYFCYDVVYVSSSTPDGINPTRIFSTSLLSSLGYLSELVDLPKSMISGLDPETRFVLRECEFMFVFAQSQLNESVARLHMGENSEYGKMLGVDKLVWDLQSFISEAQGQVKRCTKWLESTKSPMDPRIEVNTEMAERVMTICQEMLANRKDILDLFYPRISSVVGSLVLNSEYDFSVFLFCSQYLVLVFLCCLLFRLILR